MRVNNLYRLQFEIAAALSSSKEGVSRAETLGSYGTGVWDICTMD